MIGKCECTMSISVLGDGCRYCQPQTYIDLLHDQHVEEDVLAFFSVPLVVNRNKHKWKPFYLNLNNLINLAKNTHSRNQTKKNYTKLIQPIIMGLDEIQGPVKIIYEIYAKSKALFDIGNVGSVVDKFVCDALVSEGVLEDDNIYIIPRVEFVFAGVDVKNPRAEITIIRDAI